MNFSTISLAASLATFSLIVALAVSTKALDSERPKPVISLTTLITLILLAPALARITSNSVCSSAAAAGAPPATATATGAAALTPNSSSKAFTNSDNSIT